MPTKPAHYSLSRLTAVLLSALLAGALPGAQAQGSGAAGSSGSSAPSPSTQGGQATSGAKLGRAEQNVLKELARSNIAEIDLARVALSKSQDPKVKAYAQRMVDDHGKALRDVQQLAQARGVTLPAEASAKHQAARKRLEAKSGADFDHEYMARGGVADHNALHAKLVSAQKQVKDKEVSDLLARIVPVVDEHRQVARETNGSMPGASTGSGGAGGKTGSGNGSGSGSGKAKESHREGHKDSQGHRAGQDTPGARGSGSGSSGTGSTSTPQ